MKKFQNPNLTGEVYITQNYHGENASNPNDLSIQCAIDISSTLGAPRYSICDGKVEVVTDELNGYVSIIPTGEKFRYLEVHVYDFQVKVGDIIKAGTLLGYTKLGGTGVHRHIGLKNINGKTPQPQIMDYFDRSIIFRTTYQDIANDWFNGKISGNINWNLFHDYYYGSDTNNPTTFKVGDKIVWTQKENKRGGAGDKFDDLGAYIQGDIAIIKDGPRASQNSQFGKGSNDSYTWFDTQPSDGSSSCWVADMGKFIKYIPPVVATPTVPTPEPTTPDSVTPTPEAPTDSTTQDTPQDTPTSQPDGNTPTESNTDGNEKKTFFEILLKFFTDLLQRLIKSE